VNAQSSAGRAVFLPHGRTADLAGLPQRAVSAANSVGPPKPARLQRVPGANDTDLFQGYHKLARFIASSHRGVFAQSPDEAMVSARRLPGSTAGRGAETGS